VPRQGRWGGSVWAWRRTESSGRDTFGGKSVHEEE